MGVDIRQDRRIIGLVGKITARAPTMVGTHLDATVELEMEQWSQRHRPDRARNRREALRLPGRSRAPPRFSSSAWSATEFAPPATAPALAAEVFASAAAAERCPSRL